MVVSDLLMVPLPWRVELKSASAMYTELSVTTSLIAMKLQLFAHNWGSHLVVSSETKPFCTISLEKGINLLTKLYNFNFRCNPTPWSYLWWWF